MFNELFRDIYLVLNVITTLFKDNHNKCHEFLIIKIKTKYKTYHIRLVLNINLQYVQFILMKIRLNTRIIFKTCNSDDEISLVCLYTLTPQIILK